MLVPQVVYGYFCANGDGDDLVVWTDESRTDEAARFHYPRQKAAPYLCIADFFRPIESGELDYAAFHIVTMGAAVSEATAKLFAANEYQQYLLLHGLGVEMAEALAEHWHHRIREEWGFVGEDGPTMGGLFRQQYRGGRYSWGYPACPDLEDNATVARLLGADRLGIEVGEETGWQYQPEQTTSAIICHHPQAKYFVARAEPRRPLDGVCLAGREPTMIVVRRARPGREREFERWIRRLVARAADAPGAVDAELQPPDALHPGEWVAVDRFADNDSLERWLHSPARSADRGRQRPRRGRGPRAGPRPHHLRAAASSASPC